MIRAALSVLTEIRAAAGKLGWLRNDRGTAAVEFALIFPVMLTLMFSMATVTERMLAIRKLENVANTLADLAAAKTKGGDVPGQAAITDADVTELFKAAEFLISPMPVGNLHIDVYEVGSQKTFTYTNIGDSIMITPGPRKAKVAWKASQQGLNRLQCNVDLGFGAEGAANTLPSELSNDFSEWNRYVIVVHVSYDYMSTYGTGMFGWTKRSPSAILRTAYARPRNVFNPAHIQNKASNATSCSDFKTFF